VGKLDKARLLRYAAIHRGVNIGSQPYEEIVVFFLDQPDDVPQPTSD
jgi:hypothetical protein